MLVTVCVSGEWRCVRCLTSLDQLVNVRVQVLEIALPPESIVCGEQRPSTLALQDSHPQDGSPVLQQLFLSAAHMHGLKQRHIPLPRPAAAGVHQRQVVDGHLPVFLVVGVGTVSVAVVLVSAGVGLIPVVSGDGRDQQQQGQDAEREAYRRYRHRHWTGSPHGRTAPGPGAALGRACVAVFVTPHLLQPSSLPLWTVSLASR